MLRNIKAVVCFVLIIALLAGCGGNAVSQSGAASSQAGGGETIVMKLSHSKTEEHPYHLGAVMFTEKVKERLGDRVEFTIYPNGQLGSNSEVLEAATLGSLDIVVTDDGLLSGLVPDFSVLGLPYIFQDTDHVHRVVNSETGDELSKLLEPKGILIVCWLENGFRHITNNKRPIRTVSDLQGLKIRTPTTKLNVDTFNLLGAQASPIAYNELYSALQLGTVDAQENPLTNVLDTKLYEVQEYLSISNHIHTTEPIVMAMETWKKFTPEEQEVIIECGREVSQWAFNNSKEQFSSELEQLKQLGMKINDDLDRDEFFQATQPLYDELGKNYGELIKKVQNG